MIHQTCDVSEQPCPAIVLHDESTWYRRRTRPCRTRILAQRGLSVLVRGPDFTVLYDAGTNDDLALGDNNRTIAYLKTLQPPLEKLDHVILSHPHRDHVELLADVITRFKPNEVWNSGAFNNICGYRNFLLAIAANPSMTYHTASFDSGTEDVPLEEKKCYGDDQPKQTVALKHGQRISAGESIALGKGRR